MTELFSLQINYLQSEGDMILIQGFIAVLNHDKLFNKDRPGEERLSVKFHRYSTRKL